GNPSSLYGISNHGVSVNSTYKTPSRHCLGEYLCRPGERNRRGGSTSSGSNFSHNSSETRQRSGFNRPILLRREPRVVVIAPGFDTPLTVPPHFERSPRHHEARPPALDQPHLLQRRKPAESLDLDLADTLPRDAEMRADLAERARVGLVEAVAQDDHV